MSETIEQNLSFKDLDLQKDELDMKSKNIISEIRGNEVSVQDVERENELPDTKEEEWTSKKTSELTKTQQIQTRVKRHVMFQNGTILEDSGPSVFTNIKEDFDKKKTTSTAEHKYAKPPTMTIQRNDEIENGEKTISNNIICDTTLKPKRKKWSKIIPKDVALITDEIVDESNDQNEDGLIRILDKKRIISHVEKKEELDIEDSYQLGDFSDENYVEAAKKGGKFLSDLLSEAEDKKYLKQPVSKINNQSTKTQAVIDTENTLQKCFAKTDGTLITESKTTTSHEQILDAESPAASDDLLVENSENNVAAQSSQRFYKQKDERNVEYIADGKTIAKEMRFAAETEQMEKKGQQEVTNDWDSLSDRIRKQRRTQKTMIQHQREPAILADRKDALTKRPLNFDREEETRKGETMKWLESHFGSESTASTDSNDVELDLDASKKSFFNITIKSNQLPLTSNRTGSDNYQTSNGKHKNEIFGSASTLPTLKKTALLANNNKYFQGITNWNERNNMNYKQFASEAFKKELLSKIEENNLKHVSREDLMFIKPLNNIENLQNNMNNEQTKIRTKFRCESKPNVQISKLKTENDNKNQKEDIINISNYRNNYKNHHNLNEDQSKLNLFKTNSLKRQDSGYLQDSKEDIRLSLNENEKSTFLLSAKSSERYSTVPKLRTPDSGVKSPSPDNCLLESLQPHRPIVPLRKKVIEKKIEEKKNRTSLPEMRKNVRCRQSQTEPPPDYSPLQRSPSNSPINLETYKMDDQKSMARQMRFSRLQSEPLLQDTDFELSSTRQNLSTQTSPQLKQPTKVGKAIGNSFRKLVGKIRSVSAERKLKIKSKNKDRVRSPSPLNGNKSLLNESTYQQYNIIDAHIGEVHSRTKSSDRDDELYTKNLNKNLLYSPIQKDNIKQESRSQLNPSVSIAPGEQKSIGTADRGSHRTESYIFEASPKQRYYLGENPYGNSIFGKENKYLKKISDSRSPAVDPQVVISKQNFVESTSNDLPDKHVSEHLNRNQVSSTLGRYQKHNERYMGSTPNLNSDTRSSQTLPRKLEQHPARHSSTINVSIVNQLNTHQHKAPLKPARTHQILNRSKSFNVHGMNGTNDPSPIYLEKITRNSNSSNIYKSNPHLSEFGSQLKSPSIVNLISRSQKDLVGISASEQTDRRQLNYLKGSRVKKQNSSLLSNHNSSELLKTQFNEEAIDVFRINPSNKYIRYVTPEIQFTN